MQFVQIAARIKTMNSGKFSWLFIVALGAVSLWVISKLNGNNGQTFTGVTNQRGMFGYDQFGNPVSNSSSGILSS
jgi:hypothetical protein